MKSPSGSCNISREWVEFVVQHHEAKSHPNVTVKLSSFSVVPATKPGENFNSELVRVEASADLRPGGSEDAPSDPQKKDYSFIVKFLSADPFNKEMIKAMGQHVNEFMMYSELPGELNAHWETNASCLDVDQRIHAPEYIYGVCTSSEYVLVLENCKESKYETSDVRKGLDLAQVLLTVNQLARLHALSRSYNMTTEISKKYSCFAFNALLSDFMKPLGGVVLECAVKYLKTLPEHKDIVTKLEKSCSKVSQKFGSAFGDQSQHKMLCLTHGDFWNNNLLFRYHQGLKDDEERELEDIKLIDWQLTRWNNPMFDLHYLLCTSTASKIRDDHLDDILHHYHSTFMSVSENLKTPVPNWNYDEFYAEFGRTAPIGLLLGLCTVQGTLSKAGEKIASSRSSPQSQKSFSHKLKTAAAKVMVPLALKPSFWFINKLALKKMISPIVQELIEGKNTVLNERFMGLILEADRKGVLDSLST